MDILQQFMTYAGEFEKTYIDDDWSRLTPYFANDAVYEVKAQSFGGRLVGPGAIFAAIKKSLDGFDRKFSGRDIAVTDGPAVDGDEMRVGWAVTYSREGWTPFVLRGRSVARYRDGVIAYLSDAYDPSVESELADWQRANGAHVDPSYT
jgi:SnoaL-like domain